MNRILFFFLFIGTAFSQTHTLDLAWDDPNTPDDQVVAFIMEESVDNGTTWTEVATIVADPDVTSDQEWSATLVIGSGKHVFRVSAENLIGLRSLPSNELIVQTNNPQKLIIRVR